MTVARIEDVAALAQAFGQDMGDVETNVRKITTDAARAPLPTDDVTLGYAVGSRWVFAGQEWRADEVSPGGARWSPVQGGVAREAFSSIAAAAATVPGGTVRVNHDDQALPADFSGVLLEYTAQATAQNITQSGWWPDKAMRTFRTQHAGGHPDQKHSTLNLEMMANGSGKNGPFSADYGMTINVAKKGYATGNAISGEIDGLTIYGRQDGTRGLPLGSAQSSDLCGILINVQNVEDVGFVAPIEATSSNIEGAAPFGFRYRIQAQMAPIIPNAPGGPISYGHVVVAKDGANNHAYYAAAEGTATWANILHSPQRVSVTWDGEYRILTPDWPLGAARLMRGRAANDTLQIINRGTGALMLTTSEAAPIKFVTSDTQRLRVSTQGHLVPEPGQSINLGDPASRFTSAYLANLFTSGTVTMANLPTTDPGIPGRLWRDAANGNVLKVSA